jgi:putative nucleotidyltransferase with HDIG domain
MSNPSKKRTRLNRVAPLDLPPGRLERALMALQRGDVLLRLFLCLVTAVAIWALTGSWAPPFTYRLDYTPQRDVTAKVAFKREDVEKTRIERDRVMQQTPYVYRQNPKDFELQSAALKLLLDEVSLAENLADLKPDTWRQFMPPDDPANPKPIDVTKSAEEYKQFHSALLALGSKEKRDAAVDQLFAPLQLFGVLETLPEQHLQGRNRQEIGVLPLGASKESPRSVLLSDVLLGDRTRIRQMIRDSFGNSPVADRVTTWLMPQLRTSLSIDEEESRNRQEVAAQAADVKYQEFQPGSVLAPMGKPITPEVLALLRLEYEHATDKVQESVPDKGAQKGTTKNLPLSKRLERTAAVFCMIFASYVLCGYYIFFREPRLLRDMTAFCVMLGSAIVVITLVHWTKVDPWRAELIPILLFSMTFGIAYHRDVALILSLSMAVVVAMIGGEGLGEFIVLMGTAATAVLQLGTIRTRSKLIRVGVISAAVAFLLTMGVNLFDEQPLNSTMLLSAGRNALWTFLTGFLMTGLLPNIEKLFGVLTDLSLLELGDVSHPLLQELVRRAPGTYNHSISVASIAEAAAESIGCRGLLCRVGAYFHDIGKMLKPNYFVENQGLQSSRHEGLMPAMSTLIIIAHVKDGADLARQHKLPQAIIDFIEQHHGTTLVEYFYRRASEAQPEPGEVQESSYRYPGPKPQTVESAILMMADSVESASRTLVEPTPSRIENLVEQIGMNKLLDGQFDECGLTLQQLRQVEDSLIKSLTAVYHGRVKYASTASA